MHRASFQAQRLDESFSDHRTAPSSQQSLPESTPLWQLASEEGTGQTSLAESNLPLQQALGGRTSQKLQEVPPPTQLWRFVLQLRQEMAKLHQVVGNLAVLLDSQLRNHSLDAELGDTCAKHSDNKNNNNNTIDDNNNTTNTNNNHTNNNNNNNDNNYNKSSLESSLNSLDLDNDNPESEPDLDAPSLASFNPAMGVESSLRSLDQHEADLSLTNLGHQTMTIGSSLRSLDQKNDQQGKHIGTAWEPSLEQTKESFDRSKPKKRVTFGKVTFAACNDKQQNNGQQQKSSQLEQLEHKKQNNKENSCESSLGKHSQLPNKRCKTTLACWNLVPQVHQKQKAWQDGPGTMQQQPATASRGEDELRPNATNSLDGEDLSLGSLESQTQATKLAYRSPKHNNNTSSLGIGTKNKAAYGILIDTGAAISLAQ